jgi:uncharacterized protein
MKLTNEADSAAGTIASLREVFLANAPVGIAVSGGVDSMTLAVVAGDALGERARMYHAVSPAVPSHATERVQRYASLKRWQLELIDAGEFGDENYLANPVDRCFYCKQNLYAAIRERVAGTIYSGTNIDDLGDYRPGLIAAESHAVDHPFVAVGARKEDVRNVARHLGLDDLSELPAAPCLSSRIETGIAIDPELLPIVDRVELEVRALLNPSTVRCRVRADHIDIELDSVALAALRDTTRESVESLVRRAFSDQLPGHEIKLSDYRMGSAFVGIPTADGVNGRTAGSSG